jgi:hypothetical protein
MTAADGQTLRRANPGSLVLPVLDPMPEDLRLNALFRRTNDNEQSDS